MAKSLRDALRVPPGEPVDLAGLDPRATPLAPGGKKKTADAMGADGAELARLQEALAGTNWTSVRGPPTCPEAPVSPQPPDDPVEPPADSREPSADARAAGVLESAENDLRIFVVIAVTALVQGTIQGAHFGIEQLFFVGRLGLISSLVNFGALFGFCLLHVSVVNHYVIRKRSRNYLMHLVVPVIGFGIIGYVLTQADTNAKVGGVVWLAVGALVFVYFLLTGRSPELAIGEGA